MSGGVARRPFWLLALLIGSATIGMHVFVPALPLLVAEFRIDPARAQLTISLYMIVIAAGQLVYGPLSDRYGRKPVLIGALTLFTLSGIAVALAQSFDALLAGRIAQAAGGCAGLVLGRTVVHDTVQGPDAARTIAAVNAVLLISPTLAPVVGVWAANTFGWRSIPLLLAALGALTVAGVAWRLGETATSRAEPFGVIAARYRALIRLRPFQIQVLAGSFCTTTMFVLLTATPFVVMETLNRPLEDAALFYAVFVAGLMAGNLISGRAQARLGNGVFVLATAIGLLGALVFLGAVWTGVLGAPVFLVSGFLYTLMAGTMAPLTLTRAVSLSPGLRGSATGIFGASQFAVGALGVIVAGWSADLALSSAVVLSIFAASALTIYTALWLRG